MKRVRDAAKRHHGQTGPRGAAPSQPSAPVIPNAAEAASQAHERWIREGAAILADFTGSGQCTEWAAKKRPDLIQKVFEGWWAAELQRVRGPPMFGAAAEWPTSAAAVGYQISEDPAPGALVVWQPGVEGASEESGHVGYVESVSPDGSTFSTSEENFGELFAMGYRTLSATPVTGRSFILP
jgi:surface antigen